MSTIFDINKEFQENSKDFLDSDKKILLIHTYSILHCTKLLQELENVTDYIISEVFPETKSIAEFLFLLRLHCNPNKTSYETKTYFNKQINSSLSLNLLINSVANIFKPDSLSYIQQINQLFKSLNNSNVAVIINMQEKLSQEMIDFISTIVSDDELGVKFILIYNDNSNDFLLDLHLLHKYTKYESLLFSNECLKESFTALTDEQIVLLKDLSDNDVYKMQNIYYQLTMYGPNDLNTSDILYKYIQSKIDRSFNDNEKYILGLASYLVEKFTKDKISTIINVNNHINKVVDVATIIEEAALKNILIKQENEYAFYTKIVKCIFEDLNSAHKKTFHKAIAEYLKKYSPFDYTLREFHLHEANEKRASDMIAMQVFHCLHFQKPITENFKAAFIKTFNLELYNTIIEVYSLIEKELYFDALINLSKVDMHDSSVIIDEIEYLELYLKWKLQELKDPVAIERQFNDFDSDCEFEHHIFILLLKLSILTNGGDALFKTERPNSVFKKLINNLDKNSVENDYLRNVLYRKSNTAMQRGTAMTLVNKSFQYFSDRKELFARQYFMAGNNYVALLLQSLTFKTNVLIKNDELYKCTDPIYIINQLLNQLATNKSSSLYNYLYNNYIVASVLLDINITTEELIEFADTCKYVNLGAQIMSFINIGAVLAIRGEVVLAQKYWNTALSLNNKEDTYYEYLLQNNILISNLITEEHNHIDNFAYANFIMQDDLEISQYYKYRNELLVHLSHKKTTFSYEYLLDIFSKTFENKLSSPLKLFSMPYMLSDVQFWSEN